MRQIQVDIDAEGKVQVKAGGVTGRSCLDLTRQIEQALGRVVDRKQTPEFYQQEQRHGQQAELGPGR